MVGGRVNPTRGAGGAWMAGLGGGAWGGAGEGVLPRSRRVAALPGFERWSLGPAEAHPPTSPPTLLSRTLVPSAAPPASERPHPFPGATPRPATERPAIERPLAVLPGVGGGGLRLDPPFETAARGLLRVGGGWAAGRTRPSRRPLRGLLRVGGGWAAGRTALRDGRSAASSGLAVDGLRAGPALRDGRYAASSGLAVDGLRAIPPFESASCGLLRAWRLGCGSDPSFETAAPRPPRVGGGGGGVSGRPHLSRSAASPGRLSCGRGAESRGGRRPPRRDAWLPPAHPPCEADRR